MVSQSYTRWSVSLHVSAYRQHWKKELKNRPLGTQLLEWRDNKYHKNNRLLFCAEPAEGTTFPQNQPFRSGNMGISVEKRTQFGSKGTQRGHKRINLNIGASPGAVLKFQPRRYLRRIKVHLFSRSNGVLLVHQLGIDGHWPGQIRRTQSMPVAIGKSWINLWRNNDSLWQYTLSFQRAEYT